MDGFTAMAFVPPTEDGRDGAAARRLYHRAARAGFTQRLRARWAGQARGLLDLKSVASSGRVRAQHDGGLQAVEISRIRGSEGRTADFDARFYPLHQRTAGRWQSVATARYRDLVLPPVELILVGDSYYVRDGHHRVSVAVARGEWYVEAHVTVWALAAGRAPAEETRMAGATAVAPLPA
jgi:hypothetical protein